jgi:hypothetical protein
MNIKFFAFTLTAVVLAAQAVSATTAKPAAAKPNVLFIAVDDLNDWWVV